LVEHLGKQFVPSQGFIIAFLVVAVSRMAPGDKNSVGSFGECFQNKLRVDAAAAHDPDDAKIGSVSHAGCAGQVSAGVRAPVAQETDEPGLKSSITHQWPPKIIAFSIKINI
jgi:hypothetical protein